eukprot:TRINITY_DN10076_c0_g1_i1.p1 TRINITY_DN10076_c0_g1~~TRINITY_DN10076_c0_g1_i1.p1  ORF type:complete len:471 (-),score=118.27 TRINITY_DN10076_c0_g1_i1:12-1424(-)
MRTRARGFGDPQKLQNQTTSLSANTVDQTTNRNQQQRATSLDFKEKKQKLLGENGGNQKKTKKTDPEIIDLCADEFDHPDANKENLNPNRLPATSTKQGSKAKINPNARTGDQIHEFSAPSLFSSLAEPKEVGQAKTQGKCRSARNPSPKPLSARRLSRKLNRQLPSAAFSSPLSSSLSPSFSSPSSSAPNSPLDQQQHEQIMCVISKTLENWRPPLIFDHHHQHHQQWLENQRERRRSGGGRRNNSCSVRCAGGCQCDDGARVGEKDDGCGRLVASWASSTSMSIVTRSKRQLKEEVERNLSCSFQNEFYFLFVKFVENELNKENNISEGHGSAVGLEQLTQLFSWMFFQLCQQSYQDETAKLELVFQEADFVVLAFLFRFRETGVMGESADEKEGECEGEESTTWLKKISFSTYFYLCCFLIFGYYKNEVDYSYSSSAFLPLIFLEEEKNNFCQLYIRLALSLSRTLR